MRTLDADVSMRNVELDTTDSPALVVAHGTVGTTRKITIDSSTLATNTAIPITCNPAARPSPR